ncbi:hypothetical protein SAMN05660282_01931 [Corynebacterium spheniscorum]|uniref:Uncharacterized protein n=1 Tax=Corynebacterium spheniscorum TaxID=185761 RepID=A0A1I2UL33_9CORY|nr:hypothetical protein SAMN05660282_01931 [Corynebacterium spheniscorum]
MLRFWALFESRLPQLSAASRTPGEKLCHTNSHINGHSQTYSRYLVPYLRNIHMAYFRDPT